MSIITLQRKATSIVLRRGGQRIVIGAVPIAGGPDLSDAVAQSLGVAAAGVSADASRADHVHAHGNLAGGALHAVASGAAAGFMSTADKTKLDGIEEGATAGGGDSAYVIASLTWGAAQIVGSGVGTLGHADGVIGVAGIAGKVIVPLEVYIDYTLAGAAYTGGGNLRVFYDSVAGQSWNTPLPNSSYFSAGAHRQVFLRKDDGNIACVNTPVGENLRFRSDAPFTQPGSAAGTAIVKVFYALVDIP